ncbi:MAG TPA: YkgJ family cysteine cluster protein [Gaiellales bacterium]|jgi:Fe-S-cluster containining protein|nr:YkgJ family cysteine cluster protein [Gaiellales bacterium]
MAAESDLAAGGFGEWLDEMRAAVRGQRDADVPCDGCTACCTAGQFVHIGPDETATLARIPRRLLFPAPLMPEGHVLLPHDARGHCPMLVGGRCSIYEDRPRTCRTYDCRVFAATGIEPDDGLIAERAARWRFTYASDAERGRHEALRTTAVAIRERTDGVNATERAVRALEAAGAA